MGGRGGQGSGGPERSPPSLSSPRRARGERPGSFPRRTGLFRNHHEAILMRQWVRNAAPSRAAGGRAELGTSTCPPGRLGIPPLGPLAAGTRREAGNEWGPEDGAGGAVGPPALGPEKGVGRDPVRPPPLHTLHPTHSTPPPRSQARPGRSPFLPVPSRRGWGAPPESRGPRRGPPRGSSPPRCHVPPALRLRDGPAPCSGSAGPRSHRAGPREAPLGTGRGASRAQPAARRPPSRPGDSGDCAAAPPKTRLAPPPPPPFAAGAAVTSAARRPPPLPASRGPLPAARRPRRVQCPPSCGHCAPRIACPAPQVCSPQKLPGDL